ncbi:MAG: hypothetical protein KBC84_08240 [Proteobacteria bacterium]|nr:hypothetical protein [Pseudomonadota bacterium]
MGENYITDCSGNKIAIGEEKYAARCYVGNTEDFLADNDQFVIRECLKWKELKQFSLLYPIYNSGENFIQSLISLIKQDWLEPRKVEIILLVNEYKTNHLAHTTKTLDALKNNSLLLEAMNTSSLTFHTLYLETNHGLAEIYRKAFSTLIARVKSHVDSLVIMERDLAANKIEELYKQTVFAVIDDDLIFKDKNTFPQALLSLLENDRIVLGDVSIEEVESSFPELNKLLKLLMNLFIDFKNDLGICIHTPRAALVKDLFHLPGINLEAPFADQIWFANAAKSKEKLFVPVTTTIEDEIYPSNANMMKELSFFLKTGDNQDSLRIFENILTEYKSAQENHKYCCAEVEKLLTLLKTRDIKNLETYCKSLSDSRQPFSAY